MTKLTIEFELREQLDEPRMEGLSDVHKVYGINTIELDSEMKHVSVEYDASRLNAQEVEAALRRAGIPIVTH